MNHQSILLPLERALRFFAVLIAILIPTQIAGLVIYLTEAWPQLRETLAQGVVVVLGLAFVAGFVRSGLWIWIYWSGARAFRLLRTEAEGPNLGSSLSPVLRGLTRLLVASCLLDVLFLPAFFWNEVALPVWFSGWRLGLVELARLLVPQAFGVAALFLAFLTHQYGRLLAEHGELKDELALTV